MNSKKNKLTRLKRNRVSLVLLSALSFLIGSSSIGCNSEQQADEALKKMNAETADINKQAAENNAAMITALEGLKDASWQDLLKATANGDEAGIAKAKDKFFERPEAVAKQLADIYSAPSEKEDAELRVAIELAPEFVDSSKNSTQAESIIEPLFLFRFSEQSAEQKQLAAASFDRCVDFAIKHGTQNPMLFVSRGHRNFGEQQLDASISDFTKAIELDPQTEAAFIGRGNIRLAKKDFPQAIDDLNHAIEINPDNFQTRYLRGVSLIQIADSKSALVDLNRAIELNPEFVPPLKFRAEIYRSQGENEKADADLKLALELEAGSN